MERQPADGEEELSAPEDDDLAEPEESAGHELRRAVAKLLRALADRIERG